jgi:abortive infection bacteriophage resistance protein
LEFFTFGTIVNLHKNLKEKALKQEIATRYGIRNEKVLENYFSTLVEMRNVCAHSAVLFDHTLYKRLHNGPAIATTTENANQVFPAIKVIWFILNSISQNRADELKNNIISLFAQYENDNFLGCIIDNCIGYKNNF